jgi:hypothetical protein
MKKKIAILGARGYVGSNLSKILVNKFDIVEFTHKSNLNYGGGINYQNAYMPSSILGNVDEFYLILFLLESKNNSERKIILKLFESIIKESKKAKIIFFSTFSVYSYWISPYTKFKKKFELISHNYNNVYVIRPGVIYGGYPGGLYKKFIDLRKRLLLIIPAAEAITGFIHIDKIAEFILMFGDKNVLKITTLIDINMSLSDAIHYFGFRGFMIKIPTKYIRLVIKLVNILTNNSIDSLQSLASIISMNIPSDLRLINSGKLVFRKILLSDFVRINKKNSLQFSLRKFIRKIEESNSPYDYLKLTETQKYIFLKRFFEIYNLSKKNEN